MTTMTLSEASKELRDASAQALGLPNRRWYASLADAIDAHLAKGAQEWQPIETAPRDGTPILISNGVSVMEARWLTECQMGQFVTAPGWQVVECEDGWYSIGLEADWPTHWMPLPAAPMLSQRGEG